MSLALISEIFRQSEQGAPDRPKTRRKFVVNTKKSLKISIKHNKGAVHLAKWALLCYAFLFIPLSSYIRRIKAEIPKAISMYQYSSILSSQPC